LTNKGVRDIPRKEIVIRNSVVRGGIQIVNEEDVTHDGNLDKPARSQKDCSSKNLKLEAFSSNKRKRGYNNEVSAKAREIQVAEEPKPKCRYMAETLATGQKMRWEEDVRCIESEVSDRYNIMRRGDFRAGELGLRVEN
jgi:hypothetical protein